MLILDFEDRVEALVVREQRKEVALGQVGQAEATTRRAQGSSSIRAQEDRSSSGLW